MRLMGLRSHHKLPSWPPAMPLPGIMLPASPFTHLYNGFVCEMLPDLRPASPGTGHHALRSEEPDPNWAATCTVHVPHMQGPSAVHEPALSSSSYPCKHNNLHSSKPVTLQWAGEVPCRCHTRIQAPPPAAGGALSAGGGRRMLGIGAHLPRSRQLQPPAAALLPTSGARASQQRQVEAAR